jgi:hypothetical protein
VRTAVARCSMRMTRSENMPWNFLMAVSRPCNLRSATSAVRSAGCSYAREEIPGNRVRPGTADGQSPSAIEISPTRQTVACSKRSQIRQTNRGRIRVGHPTARSGQNRFMIRLHAMATRPGTLRGTRKGPCRWRATRDHPDLTAHLRVGAHAVSRRSLAPPSPRR